MNRVKNVCNCNWSVGTVKAFWEDTPLRQLYLRLPCKNHSRKLPALAAETISASQECPNTGAFIVSGIVSNAIFLSVPDSFTPHCVLLVNNHSDRAVSHSSITAVQVHVQIFGIG